MKQNANETKRLRAGRYTTILDARPHKCRDDSYQNWVQFRLIRKGRGIYAVERKSNADGNGQTWDACGTIVQIETDGDTFGHLRLDGRDSLTVMAGTILARYFGLSYANETKVGFPYAKVKCPKGRLGAGPSLLRPDSVRDKNRNTMRERVAGISIHDMRVHVG